MGLVGFRKLIHFDVLLGNAKCTILVLNMRWNKMRNLHSLNLIEPRGVNRLISLVTVCSSYLAENASGYGVH